MTKPLIEPAEKPRGSRESADEYVVERAAELFLRDGIEGVKMVDIAEASGMGVATLYRHFATKARIAVLAATLLWGRFNQRLMGIVESPEFLGLNGMQRLRVLLEGYCEAYTEYGSFVGFIDEFDHLVVAGQLDRRELIEYGAALDSFYLIFEDAYQMGLADGSIVRRLEFRPFYLAMAHALMGVAQKLRHGEIIPSDDFSTGQDELQNLVNMALWSLAGDARVPGVADAGQQRG